MGLHTNQVVRKSDVGDSYSISHFWSKCMGRCGLAAVEDVSLPALVLGVHCRLNRKSTSD